MRFVQASYGIEFAHWDRNYFRVICLREVMPHKLDLRGAIVPFSLLKVIREFKLISPGETLEVFWSDPDIPADLFRVLPDSSYELEDLEEISDGAPSYRIKLVKKQSTKSNQGDQKMTDLNSIEVAGTVDARGSACPGPLLEAKKGIGKVKVGEVLEIYSNESGAIKEIEKEKKEDGLV